MQLQSIWKNTCFSLTLNRKFKIRIFVDIIAYERVLLAALKHSSYGHKFLNSLHDSLEYS